MLEMFGKIPDQQIAEELDISLNYVRNFRREQGMKQVRRPTMTALERNRMYKYGITPEAFREMVQKQDGRCAICEKEVKKFHVDHSHKNGKVRGLLCSACNVGIGLLQDDPSLLLNAAEYIKSKD